MKGKRVAFSATKSTSGNLIPRYLLANSGLHLSDLGRYANFDYQDTVVKAVLKGQQDAGAVRDSIEIHPDHHVGYHYPDGRDRLRFRATGESNLVR